MVVLGLSITSSWGNGHASTYRGLVRELVRLGHRVIFLERDVPWYAENRDLRRPPYGHTYLYRSLHELRGRFGRLIRRADFVMVGSYVPQGLEVGYWVMDTASGITAFYDIDTPVTLAKLARGDYEYISPELVKAYDLYLSFTGGPVLRRIEREFGSAAARPLYCGCNPEAYQPKKRALRWDLGYLGTFSLDRQPVLNSLMLDPARVWRTGRFVVAGPKYPKTIRWPRNVARIEHLSPPQHADFYNAQRFTLNVTRADMVHAGYSPSIRLFEAAACGIPIISDHWPGLETFFEPGREILVSRSAEETRSYLRELPEVTRLAIGRRSRRRALHEHTAAHRAATLVRYVREVETV
jgi:spore maturation protein CgeB